MTLYSVDIKAIWPDTGFGEGGIVIVGGGPGLCCLANGGAETRALRGAFGPLQLQGTAHRHSGCSPF
jgi:hypothetical protein